MTDDATLAPGTMLADRYRVECLLGQGAMGAVYRVEHVHMRKRLALKVLLPEVSANEEVVARFEREAMAAAHIDHPNVVAATDFGRTADGAFFLVLEYVEGESLREALARDRGFEVSRATRIASQIASALARAHGLGIVHRDLKPDNVMLVRREGSGDEIVKVLDFGIAKVAAESGQKVLTQVGAVFGTPEYMAPEQAMGEVVDARADLYALGVTLYEMLTGSRPFEADNPIALLTMHVTQQPPPLSVRAPRLAAPGAEIPPALEALVMSLLAKKPDQRPSTAQEVEAALAPFTRSPGALSGDGSGGAIRVAAPDSSRGAVIGGGLESGNGPASGVAPTAAVSGGMAPWTPLDVAAKTSFAGDPRSNANANAGKPARTALVPSFDREVVVARAKRFGPFVAAGLVVPLLAWWMFGGPRHASDGTKPGTSTVQDGGASSPSRSWLSLTPKLTDERVQTASKAGLAALAELEREFPKESRIPREMARVGAAQGRHAEVLAALERLARLDLAALAQPDVDRALDSVLDSGDAEAVDAAIKMLEGPFGAHGIDVLIERATSEKPPGARAKYQRSLKKPEVRAKASPAAAVLLDLRDTKTCEAKRDLLTRAQAEGDARALALLTTYKRTRGCGFLGTADCFRCLRKDSTLDDAISALEQKR